MSVTSFAFFVFFAVSLPVYYLAPRRFQWYALLLFSLVFFLSSPEPRTIVYAAVSILATWYCARQFDGEAVKSAAPERRGVKAGGGFARALLPGAFSLALQALLLWILNAAPGDLSGMRPVVISLAAVLALYFLIPSRWHWRLAFLHSVVFLVFCLLRWAPGLKGRVFLGAGVAALFFAAARCSRGRGPRLNKKAALALGLTINLGMLAALKYNGFLVGNLNRILRLSIPAPQWAAPMGISFYTFSALAYLLGCYWGDTEAQKNPGKTALFIGFFPILTSGPILRYGETGPALFGGRRFDYKAVTFGLQRMLWGLFLKLVVSARLAVVVNTIYGDTETYPGFYIWLAAALFMFQLYTDFSGCMEIILGASECYGLRLPENFRTPFFSRSVQEFWQRWHITLGGWMRDFVLYPVLRTGLWKRMTKWIRAHWGKRAAKQIPNYLGMLCVWLLMGLWHGGAWKYIVGQGLWFWACIVLSRALEPLFKKMTALLRVNTDCFSWHLFQSLRVFALVALGNMFFRLDSICMVFRTWRAGFSYNPWIFFDDSLYLLGLDRKNFTVSMLGLAVLLLISALQEKHGSVRELISRQNLPFRWTVYIGLLLAVVVLGQYGPGYDAAAFIYERF
ncbi:MAG: MBOAT family protein [Oscillospiraceae bacterium]|nr:MBOAT family protein [Oscillospiraceae bacterium]